MRRPATRRRAMTRSGREQVDYAYVVDPEERLLGVVSFRDLIVTSGDRLINDVMRTDVISAPEDLDQETKVDCLCGTTC